MKPPSLLRSTCLWLGLAGLVFVLWAWQDSMTHSSVLSWRGYTIGSGAGGAGVHYNPALGGIILDRVQYAGIPNIDMSAVQVFSRFNLEIHDGAFASLTIPYWAMLISYLLLWSLVLGWRWRQLREARKLPVVDSFEGP